MSGDVRMKKLALIILVAVAFLVTSVSAGNDAPSGSHYNLNIIGVPHGMNGNFNGGTGARIFVDRTNPTSFYVHGGSSYQVLDHDGTDGYVGWSRTSPGLIFPYNSLASPTWRVQIWVRLVGPKTSEVQWVTKYWDGSAYVLYDSFSLSKTTPAKFTEKTNSLLADGYQDMLWTMDPITKFRNLQMRIYLLDGK